MTEEFIPIPNMIRDPSITLRDYFASQADIPWNAVLETLKLKGEDKPTVQRTLEYRSILMFAQADEMIKWRKV